MAQPIPTRIGRYDIVELVGRGGMGVLYRAHDPVLERDVALKMMLVDFSTDQTARERFEREAKAVARLQHRNVVTIHELGDSEGTPYIVMEFLSGQDLEGRVRSGTPLTLIEKLDIVSQLCDGLAYAHEQGIVHRDIKPGNVRVLEDGTVKILDFGIAKFAMSSMTQSGTIMGTAYYMAPEQVLGHPVDGRADLFATGVLLHELLVGHKPFFGDSPTAVVYQIMNVDPPLVRDTLPELPEALNDIVARALKKNPDERYSRASEMSSDLQIVKMMVDLPLAIVDPATGNAQGQGGRLSGTGKLYATQLSKTLSMPGKDSISEPKPGTTTPAESAPNRLPLFAGILAALVLAVVGYFMFGGQGSGPTTSGAATTASGPSPTETGQRPPASGGAAPAPSAAGEVMVSSVPAGARILVNGADSGLVTPAAVAFDGKSPAAIELSLKGYQTASAGLTAADLQSGTREFRLAREAGAVKLTISAPFPFELLQGAKVISASATKHDVTVQPGGAQVVARSTDLLLQSPVTIDYQRRTAEVALPAPGSLAVFSAVETCSVIVDGHDLGFPPIPRKVIAAGGHVVMLRCPDGKEDSRQITVTTGERTAVTFGPPRG